MTLRRTLREYYLKLPLAALVAVVGCAAGQQSAPDPIPVAGTTIVYLVRHAEKVTTNPSNPDPEISSLGRMRAEALAARLGASGITAIITSQFIRTQQTADPLAAQLGVTEEIVPAGSFSGTDSVVAAVFRHRGGKVLVVGHSNTLSPIIAALGGPTLPNLCENQYSILFVLYIPPSGRADLIRHRYGRSDPPPSSRCLAMTAH